MCIAKIVMSHITRKRFDQYISHLKFEGATTSSIKLLIRNEVLAMIGLRKPLRTTVRVTSPPMGIAREIAARRAHKMS